VSDLERLFDQQVAALYLPTPEPEYRFDASRRWRFDRAWLVSRIAVEIEGGTWIKGRHSRGAGMRADAEKYNAATLQGWRVLRFTGDMVKDGTAILTIERALSSRET
jgi:very-short-patch-repair endonuclease